MSYEREKAIKEAEESFSSDEYFNARQGFNDQSHRKIFYEGFMRGFDAGMKADASEILNRLEGDVK